MKRRRQKTARLSRASWKSKTSVLKSARPFQREISAILESCWIRTGKQKSGCLGESQIRRLTRGTNSPSRTAQSGAKFPGRAAVVFSCSIVKKTRRSCAKQCAAPGFANLNSGSTLKEAKSYLTLYLVTADSNITAAKTITTTSLSYWLTESASRAIVPSALFRSHGVRRL